jgi:hypothetical protein
MVDTEKLWFINVYKTNYSTNILSIFFPFAELYPLEPPWPSPQQNVRPRARAPQIRAGLEPF